MACWVSFSSSQEAEIQNADRARGHWLLSIIRQYAFRALRLSKSAFSVVSFPVVKTDDIDCAPLEGRTCRNDIYTLLVLGGGMGRNGADSLLSWRVLFLSNNCCPFTDAFYFKMAVRLLELDLQQVLKE